MLGVGYEPLVRGIFLLGTMWLILLWMHRNKLYLRF